MKGLRGGVRGPFADLQSDRSSSGPLEGVRVVDFTANAAGPSCTQLLADFGADVIKIEPPSGDSTRHWGESRYGPGGEFTAHFLSLNRNKRSVSADLKAPKDLESILRLVENADVVVESFKPGVTARLGISADQLRSVKDDLVYCSLSGFGQSGPLSMEPAYDMLMQAFAGHMSITGEPGRASVRSGPSAIDLTTGILAAFGIVLALRHRDLTGQGQEIDASLFDSALFLLSNHLAEFTATGQNPDKFGSHFPLMAPYGVFQSADREFYLGISSDQMWADLCQAIDNTHLVADERFRSNRARVQNVAELHEILMPIFRSEPARYWLKIGSDLGVPVSLVQSLEEVAAHAHTRHRGLLEETGVQRILVACAPLRLTGSPATVRRPAPRLGADNTILDRPDSSWPADEA